MEICIKWNVCRVCLKEAQPQQQEKNCQNHIELHRIFKDNKLPKQIYECSGVLMKPGDSLPDKICRKCLITLNHAVNFRSTCRNTDEYLHSIVQKTKSATSLISKFDKRNHEDTVELVDDLTESHAASDSELIHENVGYVDSGRPHTQHATKTTVDPDCAKVEVDSNLVRTNMLASVSVVKTERMKSVQEKLNNSNNVVEQLSNVEFLAEDEHVEEDVDEEYNMGEYEESEYKRRLFPKITSACSLEVDGYLEEVPQEQQIGSNAKHCEENSLLRKFDKQTTAEDDEAEVDGEYFYVLNTDAVKQEYIYEEDNATATNITEESTAIELIHLGDMDDDDTKSVNSVASLDNVEYLMDDESGGEENNTAHKMDRTTIAAVSQTTKTTAMNESISKPVKIANNKRVSAQCTKRQVAASGADSKMFVCEVCGNHFTNRSLMNYHMRIHRNEKSYECELCFKRFNAPCNLTAHMRIHTGEKPYKCHFCGRFFRDRSTQIKHERVHTNEKPYHCTICGKSFSLSTSLRAHEKIHTGEKPHKCESCAKSFKLPHQLKAHLKTHLHKALESEQGAIYK